MKINVFCSKLFNKSNYKYIEHSLDFVLLSCIQVGLPSKSGVGGGIMLVIPNVMGIFTYSPPLDTWGNSSRGVEFCEVTLALFPQ